MDRLSIWDVQKILVSVQSQGNDLILIQLKSHQLLQTLTEFIAFKQIKRYFYVNIYN